MLLPSARSLSNFSFERQERIEMDRSGSVSNVDVQTKRCVPNLLLRSAHYWQAEHLPDIQ